jgi:hypothetical protein
MECWDARRAGLASHSFSVDGLVVAERVKKFRALSATASIDGKGVVWNSTWVMGYGSSPSQGRRVVAGDSYLAQGIS